VRIFTCRRSRFFAATLVLAVCVVATIGGACLSYDRSIKVEAGWRGQLFEIDASANAILISNKPEQAATEKLNAQRTHELHRIVSESQRLLSRIDSGHDWTLKADGIRYNELKRQFDVLERRVKLPTVTPITHQFPLFPIWLAGALVSLVVLWRISIIPGYRIYRGRCNKCGFDLRASEARCPECGSMIEPIKPPLLWQLTQRILRSPAMVRTRTFTVFLGRRFVGLLRPPRMEAVPMFLYLCGSILLLQGLATLFSWFTGGLRQTSDSSTLGNVIYTISTFTLGFVAFYVTQRMSQAAAINRAGVQKESNRTEGSGESAIATTPEHVRPDPSASRS
jgi:hypothetical protein